MRISKTAIAVSVLSLFAAAMVPATSMAAGGASGAAVKYAKQGQIGEVITNPYKIAPLTAIIRSGGYALSDVSVRIVPKPNGSEIKYDVDRSEVLTHGGIPVFGLYPDYVNTVEVSYTRTDLKGEQKKISESYQIYAPPVYTEGNGTVSQKSTMFDTKVVKMDGEFKDRLYLVNNLLVSPPKGSRVVWNNPSGGALEWCFYPQNAIIDATGAVRWYMNVDSIYDMENVYHGGVMMGFQQGADGALTWGYGQRYVKYDIMGREIFNRRLPAGYADFSHSFDQAQNGNYLLRVAANDVKRPDGRNVRTVRDVIVEVTPAGRVVDDWRLWEILDPYRDNVIKTLDQGAVCLNIDASKAGQTISAAELAEMDKSDNFGDVVGVGAGRNWAHVNSVDYDPTDDSIIISSRHQSAAIKIGRDKKVKWILGAPDGWKKGWAEKVLQPVDKDGKPIKCENGKCEGNFDWTWTQHTAYRIDEMSDADTLILSVFDNGDGRGLEQPALAEEKYTRGVIYKIDQKKMTVQQLWEVGKDLGHEYFSPVTGITKYMADKNSVVVFYSTAGLLGPSAGPNVKEEPAHPYLTEYRWGETKPAVELKINSVMGYQAFPISVEQAFTH